MKTKKKLKQLNEEAISRVIEMAWEDRTPFEAIESNYALKEAEVIQLMRANLKARSFKVWRERVTGRKTKHLQLRPEGIMRGYCKTQYKIRSGW
ncbi:TIGR03643 family protein [Thiomicrorhabdus indica]|uniref:TIGR03643 family protein n=1 Tax=Thiomicrorhabdus indica TaxID=2267253 RepID=UPI002AA848BC|nr:TIGR03643 family protein [Thiomicrorhabdus indica]